MNKTEVRFQTPGIHTYILPTVKQLRIHCVGGGAGGYNGGRGGRKLVAEGGGGAGGMAGEHGTYNGLVLHHVTSTTLTILVGAGGDPGEPGGSSRVSEDITWVEAPGGKVHRLLERIFGQDGGTGVSPTSKVAENWYGGFAQSFIPFSVRKHNAIHSTTATGGYMGRADAHYYSYQGMDSMGFCTRIDVEGFQGLNDVPFSQGGQGGQPQGWDIGGGGFGGDGGAGQIITTDEMGEEGKVGGKGQAGVVVLYLYT
jgi:hypothetical protein